MKKSSLLTMFFVSASLLAAQAGELPYPVFYAPYDVDTAAVFARGEAKALGGGATIVADGKFGGAARFGPTVGVPYRSAGNLPADRGTIAFWVKGQDWADDTATRTFVNAGAGAPYYTYGPLLAIQKTGLKGPVTVTTRSYGATPTNTWRNGEWHHVAVAYAKGFGTIWVDGVASGSMHGQPYDQPPQGGFYIGNTPYLGNWAKTGDTFIDDFRIYASALDDQQIAAVMRGFDAELERRPDGQWSVAVRLDPVLRGTDGAKAYVTVTPGAATVGPVGFTEGRAVLTVPAANVPVGPVRLRVTVKDCTAKLDPLELVTTKPAAAVVRLANEQAELGFDALDGRVVTIRNPATGTDYRRALVAAPLFSLITTPYASTTLTYQPEDVVVLTPSEQTCRGVRLVKEAGQQTVEIVHEFPPYLKVTCRVTLPDQSCRSDWRITVENQRPQRPSRASIVQRVNFPMLDGLTIGADETKNYLALPRIMGQLIPNPASGGGYQFADEPEKLYPGNASMSWMDLYGSGSGLYVGSHDPALPATALMSQGHPDTKSVSLGIGKYSLLWPGETFAPAPVVVGIHRGDWHWGADRYREYWTKNFAGKRRTPKWLAEADAWTGWGGPSYKFADLPHLLEGAKPLGTTYLQLWSEMMFGDADYQMVQWPNPVMGTPAELKRAIKQVHQHGGHVGFYYLFTVLDPQIRFLCESDKYRGKTPADYINRWFGSASHYLESAILAANGNFSFTDPIGTFADGYWTLCPNSEWQTAYVEDFVRQWAKYGVDCWYFDTLPFGYGTLPVCYNTTHGHSRPLNMAPGILEIYRRVQKAMDHGDGAAIANECISDICAIYGTHALGNELAGWCQPPKPEIWRYTMPDFIVYSGNCNGWYLSAYPGYEEFDTVNTYCPGNFRLIYGRVFLLGDRFDLLNTFTWRQSAESGETNPFIEKLLALRRKTKEHQYQSDFKDEVGLTVSPRDVKLEARLFRHRQNKSFTITLLDRRKDKADITLTLDLNQYAVSKVGPITLYTLDGKETLLHPSDSNGKLQFVVPRRADEMASVLVLTP